MTAEAQAYIKINRLLEKAGWRFFDSPEGKANIHSTLGQSVAGAVDGGSYHLISGFWAEVVESFEAFFNFLPLIIR